MTLVFFLAFVLSAVILYGLALPGVIAMYIQFTTVRCFACLKVYLTMTVKRKDKNVCVIQLHIIHENLDRFKLFIYLTKIKIKLNVMECREPREI